jgi:hypothetical protein
VSPQRAAAGSILMPAAIGATTITRRNSDVEAIELKMLRFRITGTAR